MRLCWKFFIYSPSTNKYQDTSKNSLERRQTCYQWRRVGNKTNPELYCSDPSWGGRNYILKWVVFVQTILADRYNNRRELWLVSLEIPSRLQYGIKKIFAIFNFYRELSRLKFLWKLEVFQLFYSHFCTKFLSRQNMLKLLIVVFLILSLKIEEGCWIVWSEFFG